MILPPTYEIRREGGVFRLVRLFTGGGGYPIVHSHPSAWGEVEGVVLSLVKSPIPGPAWRGGGEGLTEDYLNQERVVPFLARTVGIPPPHATKASDVTPWSVRLLRSRKRTFLSWIVFNVVNIIDISGILYCWLESSTAFVFFIHFYINSMGPRLPWRDL